jgi:predicted ester cyclase
LAWAESTNAKCRHAPNLAFESKIIGRFLIPRQEAEFLPDQHALSVARSPRKPVTPKHQRKDEQMTTGSTGKLYSGPAFTTNKQQDNKDVVGAWFTHFWGKTCNLQIVDDVAAPDMLLKYSLHEPRRGHAEIKAFMTDFRAAFPDLNFWGTADLIAEGDFVVGQWEGGGTHTGPAFSDFLVGSLPAKSGRKMHFTGTTVLRLKDNKIVEEIGLDDGVTALTQLGLLTKA